MVNLTEAHDFNRGSVTKYWNKIDTGWYEGEKGEIIQYWYHALGSPKNKSGWYLWPIYGDQECWGPFETMKEAIVRLLNG